jgi:hypothetical protein
MEARREVSEELRSKYRKAKKKQKGVILYQVIELTGWCRKHAAAVLSGASPISAKGKIRRNQAGRDRRGRKPKYSLKHKEVLKKVWAVLDFSSSVRVKAGMKDVLDSMIHNAHIVLEGALYEDMCAISASTINRMLKYDREAMSPRGRALTKPGSLLKSQIPIRRGADWSENKIGFVEIDRVAHCGSSGTGEFISTLDMTDVKSGWTGLRAMRNKARVHAVAAIEYLSGTLRHDSGFAWEGGRARDLAGAEAVVESGVVGAFRHRLNFFLRHAGEEIENPGITDIGAERPAIASYRYASLPLKSMNSSVSRISSSVFFPSRI